MIKLSYANRLRIVALAVILAGIACAVASLVVETIYHAPLILACASLNIAGSFLSARANKIQDEAGQQPAK